MRAARWAIRRVANGDGARAFYPKHRARDVAGDHQAEAARLDWPAGQVAVPQVAAAVGNADAAWLLSTALPRETAWRALVAGPARAVAVVDALAACVRQ